MQDEPGHNHVTWLRKDIKLYKDLRAPKIPDPTCDRGRHTFAFALYPHAGGWRESGVVGEAVAFNSPLRAVAHAPAESFVSVDDPNIVVDTIKRSEHGDATIVRVYECHGARGTAILKVPAHFTRATICNILEEDSGNLPLDSAEIELSYTPHKIISIKLK
jgi:alpha-mannosidase